MAYLSMTKKGVNPIAVKIIITRKVPKGKEDELLPFLIELRSLATAQPGYISGETLRNLDDPEDYLVISTWQTVDNWRAWAANSQRKAIQEKIDNLLGAETEYAIYLYG